LNFAKTPILGIIVMAAFAATLNLPAQLFGAVITGLTVGMFVPNEKKAAFYGFVSGFFGSALGRGMVSFALKGVSEGIAGLTLGGALGIFFGTLAMVSSITVALIAQRF